jgi:hypothetical protein
MGGDEGEGGYVNLFYSLAVMKPSFFRFSNNHSRLAKSFTENLPVLSSEKSLTAQKFGKGMENSSFMSF